MPFIIVPFLRFGVAIVQVFSKNRKRTLALYTLGCLAYFMLVYLLWSLAEIRKTRIAKTVQSTETVAEAKRLTRMKIRSHFGAMSFFSAGFFPNSIDLSALGRSPDHTPLSEDESNLCYICNDDYANAFSTLCGHGGICEFCAEELHNFYLECPICAKPVEKVCVYKGSVEQRDY